MSLDPEAVRQHLSSKKPVTTGSAGGDSGNVVIFGPVEIPREDLVSDLTWLYSLTKEGEIDHAISIAWHRCGGRAGQERMSRIVNFFRISQDGKSRPPFNFVEEYRKISGAEPAPVMVLEP